MKQYDIGLDLGTTSIIIATQEQGVVFHQPSIGAVDTRSSTILAVGDKALRMVGRVPSYIDIIRPLRDGIIQDHRMTNELIVRFINEVCRSRIIKPRVSVCVPAAITGIEADAVVEAVMAAGARQVFLVDEPVAAALGAGLDLRKPMGCMVIDIGGGSTDIAVISMGMAILIGLPLGVIAATNQYSWKDNLSIFSSLFCVSMPSFWFSLIMVMLFSLRLRILPPLGIDSWKCYIMPCLSIAVGGAANVARQTRSSMLEVIRQDYVTTARAKGQKERLVIYGDALQNALIPVITVIGGQFANMMGGSIIAEVVFSIPGVGSYMLDAISFRDYPAVRGGVLIISLCFCLIILAVDILYAFVDPRIRAQYES